MKIVHVSDIHIRNLRYHDEYRRVFEDLYAKIAEIKPDIVVNTGDTAHTKVQISPEFVEMTSEHIRRVASLAPYHIILGNHDLNLMNLDRQDAITPIVQSLQSGGTKNIHLHKKSGRIQLDPFACYDCKFCKRREDCSHRWSGGRPTSYLNLWVFSMADASNYPRPSQWAEFSDDVNIGLFHGSIAKCVTDTNWRMTHTEYDLDIFDGLDYALLGDIHKQQFFNGRRVAYAGSLIQQNFGEDPDKGFLLWDIKSKDEFTVEPVILSGNRKFYTIRMNDDLSFVERPVDPGSRIRISPPRDLTLSEQKEIEKLARSKYETTDVITLSAANIGSQRASVGKNRVVMENLRQLSMQEKLIRSYLEARSIPEKILERVLDLNRKYQIHIDQNDETPRNVSWKINKVSWSNLFNFGEDNFVDFTKLGGLTGIFAPNASGKSNFIDILLETLFDSTTRGINKNIFLINDNKEQATSIADVSANGQDYLIERVIERVKYGQRKLNGDTKEWGKTTCNFYLVDDAGDQLPLIGTLRPETERNIRQRLGSYDDMMLTALFAQWNVMDIIACKETDRKKILYKFLDLDIFEEKHKLARDEGKQHHKRLTEMEESNLDTIAADLRTKVDKRREEISESQAELTELLDQDKQVEDTMVELASQKLKIDDDLDQRAADQVVEDANKYIESIGPTVTQLEKTLETFDVELEKIANLERKFDLETAEKQEARLKTVLSDIDFRNKWIKTKQPDVASHRKSLKLLEEVPCGDQFPQCQFLIDAFDSREKLPVVESNIEKLRSEIEELSKERDQLHKSTEKLVLYREFVDKKNSIESSKTNTKLKIENMQLKLESYEKQRDAGLEKVERIKQAQADILRNEEIEGQLGELKRKRSGLSLLMKEKRSVVNELSRQMGADEGILEKIDAQLEQLTDLRETCDAFEYYTDAMGKDGIAYQIMTQKLPLINDEINKILSGSSDFGVIIEHDNDEQSIRIYIQYGEYKMRLIELGSGAEKMLASIAIRAALLSISSLPKPNMFIIDEGFGKLDSRNIENVQKIFDYLKSVFEHVLVISHVDTMKDMVDNIIEISTDESGYAHIEVGG